MGTLRSLTWKSFPSWKVSISLHVHDRGRSLPERRRGADRRKRRRFARRSRRAAGNAEQRHPQDAATLASRGYVRQDPATQAYALTLRLSTLGFRLLGARHLPDAGQSVLQRLAEETGEYCRLAVVDGGGLTWIARAQGSTQGLRYEPPMGGEVVLHATATGKAWLATLPEDEALRLVFARGFPRRRQADPGNVRQGRRAHVDELRAHLRETRRARLCARHRGRRARHRRDGGVVSRAARIPTRPSPARSASPAR